MRTIKTTLILLAICGGLVSSAFAADPSSSPGTAPTKPAPAKAKAVPSKATAAPVKAETIPAETGGQAQPAMSMACFGGEFPGACKRAEETLGRVLPAAFRTRFPADKYEVVILIYQSGSAGLVSGKAMPTVVAIVGVMPKAQNPRYSLVPLMTFQGFIVHSNLIGLAAAQEDARNAVESAITDMAKECIETPNCAVIRE